MAKRLILNDLGDWLGGRDSLARFSESSRYARKFVQVSGLSWLSRLVALPGFSPYDLLLPPVPAR